jgi:hypothetical protein
MPQWGSDGANTAKAPTWGYIANQFHGSQANVQPGSTGWEIVHPWGRETVVAIGGLLTSLGVGVVVNQSGVVGHTAAEIIKVMLRMSEGVRVVDANSANVYVVAISNFANTPNVNLLYSAVDSDPGAGELVFKSAPVDLTAGGAGKTLTINSTSTIHGAVGIVARQPTTGAQAANGTLLASSVANTNIVITTV